MRKWHRKSRREWVDAAFDNGAGAVHHFLQAPRDWQAEAMRIADGVVAGPQPDVSEAQKGRYIKNIISGNEERLQDGARPGAFRRLRESCMDIIHSYDT